MENTAYQNVWYAANTTPRAKPIILNALIENQKALESVILSLLGKEQQF